MPTVEIAKLYRVSHVDPAGGGGTAQHGVSRSAIITIGQDDMERIFILEAWIERVPTSVLEQRIFATQNKWKPAKFGFDKSATQVLFFDTLKRKALQEGVRINWFPIALHSDKLFNIETTIQPLAAAGRLFHGPERECRQLREEWFRHPDQHMNDGMDALANAIHLLPGALPEHMRMMNQAQLRGYLERIGMSREQIAAKLEQHGQWSGQ